MGFLSNQNVMLDQHAESRLDVLRAVSNKAAELGVTEDPEAVYQAFLDREEMGATGMTEGFAIPHAKSPAITVATVVVYKNDKALEWPSFDEQPVDIVIALLVPDGEAGTTHIRLLSKTAVLLMDDGFKAMVRRFTDANQIAAAINEKLEEE